MRFICDNCKAKYSIADSKIKKKVLKIRCKKCSHVIIVRDTTPKAAKPLAHSSPKGKSPLSQSNLAAVLSNPSQVQAQHPQNVPAPAPVGPAHQEESDVGERTVVARISSEWFNQLRAEKKEEPIWFMALQGSPIGPVVLSDVLSRIKNQELKRDELVWCAGWADWVPAETVKELQSAFANVKQSSIAPPPPSIATLSQTKEPQATKPRAAQPKIKEPQAAKPQAAKPQAAKPQAVKPKITEQKPTFSEAALPKTPENKPVFPQAAQTKPSPSPFEKPAPFNSFSSPSSSPIGAPQKPASSTPFPAPNSAPFGSFPLPKEESPLAALAQASKPAPIPAPTPSVSWDPTKKPNTNEQALQTAASPSRTTPTNLLAGAPSTPQPLLSELAPVPTPVQATPSLESSQQDIAHEEQARPAVEFVETNAEENFFDNGTPHKTSDEDDDLFEIALPPLPNWEPAEEIDADDIIEMSDALRPNWSKRLGIGGGVIVAVIAFSMGMSKILSAYDTPIQHKPVTTDNEPKKQVDAPNSRIEKKLGSTQNALLGSRTVPTKKQIKLKAYRKIKTRRSSAKRPWRKIKSVVRAVPSRVQTATDIQKMILAQYRKKLGEKKKKTGVSGAQSGNKLSPALLKRIYKEISRNRTQVQYCYEQYLKKAYLQGRMKIRIKIESNGTVSNVKNISRRFSRLAITKCIVRKMRRWRFASFSGTPYITMTIPYILKTSGY